MVKKLVILFGLVLSFSHSQDIKLMTYNIRYDNPNDGENNWHNRKETLVNQILFYKPDIIGTQEGLEHQIHYINDTHRGSVLEESIMMMPNHIPIIGLSATLEKPEKFIEWMQVPHNDYKRVHFILFLEPSTQRLKSA